MNSGKREREASATRAESAPCLAKTGKGGKMLWERTGFAHLFPHDSMQVVDFPHLATVRAFLDTNLASQARHEMGAQWGCSLTRNVVTNERELGKDLEQDLTEEAGPAMTVEKGVLEGGWRTVLAKNGCAQLHVFTRNYTILHNVPWLTLRAPKSGAGRQDLPIREVIHRMCCSPICEYFRSF